MKIGTSLSRCVRDIFDGIVKVDDVLVIVARTNFDPDDGTQWTNIWEGYVYGGWSDAVWANYAEHGTHFRDICRNLKNHGKLHQPRQYGSHPHRLPYHWYEMILVPEELENNPVAQDAWNTYKVAAKLSSIR